MTHLKMTGDFYDDVKKVNEAIGYLKGMIDFLEKECMERDKGKPATELFVRINDLKRATEKMVAESERLVRAFRPCGHCRQYRKFMESQRPDIAAARAVMGL